MHDSPMLSPIRPLPATGRGLPLSLDQGCLNLRLFFGNRGSQGTFLSFVHFLILSHSLSLSVSTPPRGGLASFFAGHARDRTV